MDVYPLVFEPIIKAKIWGGRTLETALGKRLPPDGSFGESWEVADLEDDQSRVSRGPAKGKTLGELVKSWGEDLIGRAPLFEGRFPLLIKFLDARDTLSVQVHPDEAMAARLGGRVRVKHEAWYVIDADEGGYIYRGVREGVNRSTLEQAIKAQDVESVLNRIPVRKGHCFYLPSGTIHALGAGVTVAEVQTPSDITYRVYDWNRIDPSTAAPRELHLEQALSCISFDTGPFEGERPRHMASVWTAVTSLVRCDSFVIERVRMVDGVDQEILTEEFVIWIVLEGHGSVASAGFDEPVEFQRGDTILIPAGLKEGRVRTFENSMWLEVKVPVASSLTGYERPERGGHAGLGDTSTPFVPLNVPNRPNSASHTRPDNDNRDSTSRV
ncbi:MAG: class I mannose-6-phosphate isomerase [Planctomycetes bacterium]|nr:class I mannose-6-phosphate isomerase [Planctomycetota bacterium]